MLRNMKRLQKTIGYDFRDPSLLKKALTHSSYVNEHGLSHGDCNERLEFLGDAALELSASRVLFDQYPEESEGSLSRLRSKLVCRAALADVARQLDLGKYLLLGKGEESTGGRERESILENTVEALIGAIYLDSGFANAKEFVERFVTNDIEHRKFFYDSKTILQERVQQGGQHQLEYRLAGEEGPDHDKRFTAEVLIDGVVRGTGTGRSKQSAEQQAAYQALINTDKE
ncbi:MAG: ribonuclease III [Lachnospiraceae bacterium]|nr:ribonuclease III [Lachnospiraceae bacterium]